MMHVSSTQRKLLFLGAVSLVLGLLGVFFLYEYEIGLNYSLFMLFVALAGVFLARVFTAPMTRTHFAVIFSALYFALMVYVRSSEFLTFFNVLACSVLLLLGVALFTGKQILKMEIRDYAKLLLLPLRFFPALFDTLPAIVSLGNVAGKKSCTREIVRGSIMAVIALVIFATLLSSGDKGFATLLDRVFTFPLDEGFIHRIILGTIITLFFVGGFGFMFYRTHTSPSQSVFTKDRTLGAIETAILLGAINFLFFAFIVVQISYLFGGADHLLAEGLTYAEYAKEGFVQLVVVAVLSLLVILGAEGRVLQRDGAHLSIFKLFSSALVLQVIIILASAFVRLSLYEDAYGFTEARFYGHAFMVWLGVVLTLLAVHVWRSGKPEDFAFRTFFLVFLFLFSANTVNPEVFIATKNIARYQATGLLDARYLGELSKDALPYTIHLLDEANELVRQDFADGLYWSLYHHCNLECAGEPNVIPWQSKRYGDEEAGWLLAGREGEILRLRELSLGE